MTDLQRRSLLHHHTHHDRNSSQIYASAHASRDSSTTSSTLSLTYTRHLAPLSFAKAAGLSTRWTNTQSEWHISPELSAAAAVAVCVLDIGTDVTNMRAPAPSVDDVTIAV